MQHAGVDADLIVAVVLPGVVLDHVEKLSNKKQDPMFRMILMETQKRQIISDMKQEGKKKKKRQKPRFPPVAALEKLKCQLR